MRCTIEGLNQEQLVEWKLDAADAVLIRWFADFYHGATMTKVEHKGKEYGWIKYQHAIDELPCLRIKTRRALFDRFAKYTACGLMECFIKKSNKGTFSCFHIVPDNWDLLTRKSAEEANFLCAEEANFHLKDSSSKDSKSAGAPARRNTPQRRLIALFFELYQKRTGKEPPWTRGKDHALLSADLKRLGEEKLGGALRALFEAPQPRMSSFRYATVHVFLPDAEKRIAETELRMTQQLRLLKTCKACGKQSETSGIDCPRCNEPDAFQARKAVSI